MHVVGSEVSTAPIQNGRMPVQITTSHDKSRQATSAERLDDLVGNTFDVAGQVTVAICETSRSRGISRETLPDRDHPRCRRA